MLLITAAIQILYTNIYLFYLGRGSYSNGTGIGTSNSFKIINNEKVYIG